MSVVEYENKLCKTIIKSGQNAGLLCLRKNCQIKNHGNIARYLNLPKEIVDVTEKHKNLFDFERMVNIIEKYSELKNLKEIIEDLTYIFSLYDNIDNKKMKFVVFIYMYNVFDKPLMRQYFDNHFNDFYELADKKLLIFSECSNPKYKIFVSYIKETFVAKRRFFSRKKNLKYNFNKLVIYLTCVNRINNLYYKILDNRYAFGGVGYLEAKEEFYNLC